MKQKNVIVVTDGDLVANRAVEIAAANINGRCISLSAGNPTWLSGTEVAELIKSTPYDPVVVMVDDRGDESLGRGEQVLAHIAGDPEIKLLGVLAVASNTHRARGVPVTCSVNRDGNITFCPVDKLGREKSEPGSVLTGDTVDILNNLSPPVVVGIGDIGKMDGRDDYRCGAPVTTKALREIMARSGLIGPSSGRK